MWSSRSVSMQWLRSKMRSWSVFSVQAFWIVNSTRYSWLRVPRSQTKRNESKNLREELSLCPAQNQQKRTRFLCCRVFLIAMLVFFIKNAELTKMDIPSLHSVQLDSRLKYIKDNIAHSRRKSLFLSLGLSICKLILSIEESISASIKFRVIRQVSLSLCDILECVWNLFKNVRIAVEP